MAKYTGECLYGVYDSLETAGEGLEAKIDAIDTGKKWLNFGILPVQGGKFGVWVAYTAED